MMSTVIQKVLIVDDSQTNLALLDHMLGGHDCEVVQAKSGAEAVALVEENDFALILLDIQMPEMNGYEAASRIKQSERGKRVPIIFITAIFQDEENVKQGYETGAVDYLFRPVDVETLKSKVQVFLDMNQQKMDLEREIAKRKETVEALSRAEANFRSLFERAVEGIFRSTFEGELKEVNPAMVRLLGYDSPEELLATVKTRCGIMLDKDVCKEYHGALRRDGVVSNFEFQAIRKDGTSIWCSESSRLVKIEDGQEFIEGVLEDITSRKKDELELQHLANIDSLTNIPNRHLFFDRAEKTLANAKRYGLVAAVLFIDLDKFKKVNDTYGHQAGDELLKEVADRLHRRIREADTLARLGGDEFGVLLTQVESEEAAKTVALGLLDVLDEPFSIKGEAVRIGATIGGSFFPEDGKDCMSLISRADSAMYGVKRRGSFRYGTFRECGVPK
jgi:diguanylate cyclase (GGDEF)-like protein/PAS domain S-box-containing protein